MKRRLVSTAIFLAALIMNTATATNIQGAERYAVFSQSFSWYDAARGRTLPVKIIYPQSDAPVRFPVVVFSHGIGGSNQCSSYLGTAWASHGIVTVHVQHPGSDENIWKGKVRILNEFRKSFEQNVNARTRARDIRFVLDRLERFAEDDQELGAKFDLTRVGVGGIDLGALAAMLVAGQVPPDGGESLYDARVKAVVAMSPPVRYTGQRFQEIYGGVQIPALFITGTEDDGVVGTTKAAERRIPFDAMSDNDRYLVTFQGAGHRIYGGRVFSLRARNDEKFQALIIRTSNCFWKAALVQDPQAEQVLNGYGLRSLLGGAAFVEQKIAEKHFVSSP